MRYRVVCALGGRRVGRCGSSRRAHGRIGYLQPLGGNEPPYGHLFAVNPDGSRPIDLTPAGYTDIRSFAWSPSGRRIAFSAIQAGDSDPELFVMNAAGGGVRRLTNNYLPDFGPSWSPKGRFIAFTSIRTGLSQIYRMRAGGSGQRRLTNAFGNCDSPAWSPRGTLIAFPDDRWLAFVRLRNGNQELWKVRTNGRALTQLTNTYGITEAAPAWQRGR